jgi:hypothetical protein
VTRREYRRIDLPIRIHIHRSDDREDLVIRVGAREPVRLPTSDGEWEDWNGTVPLVLGEAGLRHELAAWRARRASFPPEQASTLLARVTLEILDPEGARVPWEWSIERLLDADERVVRVSPVRPRAASIPLTLPLRLALVGQPSGFSLEDVTRRAFPGREPEVIDAVVRTRELGLDQLDELRREWPTAEVLHFRGVDWSEEDLLSTADPGRPGTLGWLARLTEQWQTRLVVLDDIDGREDSSRLRSLAAALVARGGPAVVVTNESPRHSPEWLYKAVLLDVPLDVVYTLPPYRFWGTSLHLGAGREELLRASAIDDALARASVRDDLLEEAVRRSRSRSLVGPRSLDLDAAKGAFEAIGGGLESFSPERDETRGFEGLGERIEQIRRATGVGAEPVRLEQLTESGRRGPEKRRHTNVSLWEGDGGDLTRVDAIHGRLRDGHTYHLALQIGPDSKVVPVVGSTALIEEVFKWSESEEGGAWVEAAVTGLDFEVVGDPVQELWLPRRGPTDPLHFAVRPRGPGAARLRVSLYHRNAVIQSIRLVAFTLAEGGEEMPSAARRQAMARALDLPIEQVEDVGYQLRVEYGGPPKLDEIRHRPPRALSIVANHSMGEAIFSIKGPGTFTVSADRNLPRYVNDLRAELEKISTVRVNPRDPESEEYAFGAGDDLNGGTPEQLGDALRALAARGDQLYKAIVSGRDRRRIKETLAEAGQTIEIAHVLLDKVIPWSILYDRGYDDGAPSKEVCLAPLSAGDRVKCGAHAACPLSDEHAQARARQGLPVLRESEVVCPLHFWGFRHKIELPVRQPGDTAASTERQAEPPVDTVDGGRPTSVVIGFNAGLRRATAHVGSLERLLSNPEVDATLRWKESARQSILRNLETPDLDVLYFYCHAEPRDDRGAFAPNLVFHVQGRAERITHSQLAEGPEWTRKPLVFLNGCGTGGFSPEALSPFLVALVRDRGAAGVVSTEVRVWEQLASELAELFLKAFLAGKSAADALLEARWSLLRRHNPLGLVYTLYASADLALAPPRSAAIR